MMALMSIEMTVTGTTITKTMSNFCETISGLLMALLRMLSARTGPTIWLMTSLVMSVPPRVFLKKHNGVKTMPGIDHQPNNMVSKL